MNIKLIPERCIACGLCQTISPIFDYDDEGIVVFSDQYSLEQTAHSTDDVLLAIKSCPTKAISLK
ncbi:TPA: ferredoxin [Streptococcus suis]|nr:ferredoxin [Streptococcus suis]NQJ75880.1 ferredoxin [Streptococcus suis]HEM4051240.1 ferredoxin [Streptococcus suis]